MIELLITKWLLLATFFVMAACAIYLIVTKDKE